MSESVRLEQQWRKKQSYEYQRCWSCELHQHPKDEVWVAEGARTEIMLCPDCFDELQGASLEKSG